MTTLTRCLRVTCLLVSLAASARGDDRAKSLSILAIGNSFTRNATQHLPAIVEASPHTLVLELAAIGGGPLDRHWKAVEAHEADPEDKAGKIYQNRSLRQILTKRRWDFVTLQQRSFISTDIESYRPYAANLAAYVRKHAPSAELVIHQTWAYRADDPRFRDPEDSQDKMYADLTRAYTTIAREISVGKIIPVGLAFRNARKHPDWQFAYPDPDFDYKNARSPSLPDQTHSLNTGWNWSRGVLRLDGHHANHAGRYLGAAVWFEFFFGTDVRTNAYLPDQLAAEDVVFLQKIAHETAGKSLVGKIEH